MTIDRIGPWAVLLSVTTMGCATASVAPAQRSADSRIGRGGDPAIASAPIESVAIPAVADLPPAPWNDAPLAANEVPAPLMASWRRADNRSWCAPVAPRSLGAGQGARPRRGTGIEGGWSVEFDRPGAPGLTLDGRTCARCGRAAFGIVGAALSPEEALPPEADAPSFRDGSRAQFEAPASETEPAAVTISINGQGCTYQVWSFLGEEHLHGLVDELRFVDTGSGATVAMDE